MVDIFVSYASADRERVAPLAQILTDHGWTVWWDRQIAPGKTFDEVIEEALDNALAVISVWTEAGVASRWVRTEASEGAARGILVPVLMQHVQIPLAFRRIQAADLTDWEPGEEHAGLEELIGALEELISAASAPEPEPVTEPEDSVERVIRAARTKALEHDWEAVISLLAPLEDDPQVSAENGTDARELLSLARRKHEAAELYEEAELLFMENRWSDVVAHFDQILELDPDFEYGTELKARAEEHLEEQRTKRLDEVYQRAVAALDARQWAIAVARFEQLDVEEPGYRDAPARLEVARRGRKSQGEYEDLQQLYDQDRWDEVIAGMTVFLQESGDFGDPEDLLARAQAAQTEVEERPRSEAEPVTAVDAAAPAGATVQTEPRDVVEIGTDQEPADVADVTQGEPAGLERFRRTIPTWSLGVAVIVAAYLPWLSDGGTLNSVNIPLSFLWTSDVDPWDAQGPGPVMLGAPILILGLVIALIGGRPRSNTLRRGAGIGLIAILALYVFAAMRSYVISDVATSFGLYVLLAAAIVSALPDPLRITARGPSSQPGPARDSRIVGLAIGGFGTLFLLIALPFTWCSCSHDKNAFALAAGAVFGIGELEAQQWLVSIGILIVVVLAGALVVARLRHVDIVFILPVVAAITIWVVVGWWFSLAGNGDGVAETADKVRGGFWLGLLGAIALLLAIPVAGWIAGLNASRQHSGEP